MTLILGWAAIGFGQVIGALAAWTLWHGAQDALAWLMERGRSVAEEQRESRAAAEEEPEWIGEAQRRLSELILDVEASQRRLHEISEELAR